jgi:hypothetical protein
MFEPLITMVAIGCATAAILPLLGLLVTRVRGVWNARRAERGRLRAAAGAEARTRALMSELCPHGWHAQVTLFGGAEGHELPLTRDGRRCPVSIDWAELVGWSGLPAVTRRVWAPTIGEALEAMVIDRRTDATLERIEQGARADGALWPDL